MPKPRIWIEILLLAVLAAIFAGRAFAPAWRSLNTDFPNYYVAARLYSQGESLARIYDWIWFQRQKDHTGIEYRQLVASCLFCFSAAQDDKPWGTADRYIGSAGS